jgi:hypothetical protein
MRKTIATILLLFQGSTALACELPTTLEITSLSFEDPEWIEVKNTGGEDLDLSNYSLEDSTAHPWTLSGILNSLETIRLENFPFQLNNNGDSVTLKTIHGVFIDTYSYSDETAEEVVLAEESPATTPTLYPIFSEALPNPEGSDSANEWIELYNPYDEVLNLSGLKLDDADGGSSPHSLSGNLGAETYLLIWVEDSGLSLNNGGDSIRLLGANDEILWTVDYTNSTEGQSYAYINDSYVWTLPTPNSDNEISSATTEENYENGDLSESIEISEVLPNPDGPDQEGEWIEITNGGTATVDLGNWTVSDSSNADPYVFPTETLIDPGESLVIDRSESGISLNNSNEILEIADYMGEVIDEVSYESSTEGESYAEISVEEMLSEQASLETLGTKVFKLWAWVEPSPGLSNPSWKQFKGTVQSYEGNYVTIFDGFSNWDFEVATDSLNELVFSVGNKVLVRAELLDKVYKINHSELLEQGAQKTTKSFPWEYLLLALAAAIYGSYEIYKKYYKLKSY